jgi:hypothetical protein
MNINPKTSRFSSLFPRPSSVPTTPKLWSQVVRNSLPSTPGSFSEFTPSPAVRPFLRQQSRQQNKPQESLAMSISHRDFDTIFDSVMARTTSASSSNRTTPNTSLAVQRPSSQRPFQATRMALEKQGLIPQPTLTTKYQGDANSNSYLAQVEGLPDSENCCLWLSNIPLLIKHADIFDGLILEPCSHCTSTTPMTATHSKPPSLSSWNLKQPTISSTPPHPSGSEVAV